MSSQQNHNKVKENTLNAIVNYLPESVMVYKQTDELSIVNEEELLTDGGNLSEVFIAFPLYILSLYNHKIERLLAEISFAKNNRIIFETLTLREKDVLKQIALGNSNKEIADKLYISVNTVETHRKTIKRKLGILTFFEINMYARAYNLI
jgi:DNA-binding CsgD family transcriptional regulator